MSRRSVPRISVTDLREHADEARIARVWDRIDHDLSGFEAPPARPSRFIYLAVAAAFAAFGGGLFAGKVAFQERPSSGAVAVIPSPDRSTVDVLAAGSEGRTFALPGGGTLTLQPGATVELERGGGASTLKLLQGEASVDTSGAGRVAGLVIVAGDARLNTQAGSVLNVSRNQDEMDVSVNDGSVNITSPTGSKKLGRGESVKAVPIHAPTTALSPNGAPLLAPGHVASRVHRPNEPRVTDPPSAAVAGPEWLARVNTGDNSGALDLLRKEPGGIDGAIASARSARELMAISDASRSKGGDGSAAISALKRVVERFPDDANAPIAAYYLAKMYNAKGQTDLAKRYQDLYPTAELAQDALCGQMRAEQDAGHKDEARRKAQEYLARYTDGPCKSNAESILQSVDPAPEAVGAPAGGGAAPEKAPATTDGGAP